MELRPRPWRMMQNTSRCRRVIGRRAARERPPKSNWHANAQCCSHASARTPPGAARERPVSYIRCSGPGARTSCECDACKRNRREACSAKRPWRMMQNTSRCRRVIGCRAARERPPKSNWHANAQCCSHASARRQVSALDQPRRHSKPVGEVFGPPIGASEAASGSSTLPEVRWSDVSQAAAGV